MADLSITATSVAASTDAVVDKDLVAGETIAAGQAVYKKAADGKLYKAQCDAATDDDVYGIALNGGAANQPIAVQRSGNISIGATVGVGTVYALSATAGGICPVADLVSTNYVTLVGFGISSSVMQLKLHTTGIAVA